MAVGARIGLGAAPCQVGAGRAVGRNGCCHSTAGQGQQAIGTLDGAYFGDRRGNQILLAPATSDIAHDRRQIEWHQLVDGRAVAGVTATGAGNIFQDRHADTVDAVGEAELCGNGLSFDVVVGARVGGSRQDRRIGGILHSAVPSTNWKLQATRGRRSASALRANRMVVPSRSRHADGLGHEPQRIVVSAPAPQHW